MKNTQLRHWSTQYWFICWKHSPYMLHLSHTTRGPSWPYGVWIYNYLCNQCLG